jgi:hypothetical protein
MVQATSTIEDLARAAENMVAGAIAVTTGRLHLDDPWEAFERVRADDAPALEYFRHELAHQIAMVLTRMDPSVVEVYMEHELPEAEEFGTPHLRVNDPVHLVVYSERETAALRSLIDAIDRSIVEVLHGRELNVAPGLIRVDIIDQAQARRVNASAGGFRPPPVRLVSQGK